MLRRFLFLWVISVAFLATHAQSLKISGKVTNEKNEAVAGASVKKVNGAGTTTNLEGRFIINAAASDSLEISAIGYASKFISGFEENSELNIVLEVVAKNLSDVTVTANRSNARRETVNALIQFQKNTNTVASVISAETIRRSP